MIEEVGKYGRIVGKKLGGGKFDKISTLENLIITMEQEYKVGLFGKIFYGALTGGVIIFLTGLLILKPINDVVVYLILSIPVILCLLVLINIFKSKVIVTDTEITRERIFYNKTLNFENIKGVRIESKIIVIEPTDPAASKFKISNYSDLAHSDALVAWLTESFTDLNNLDLETEKEAILNDNSLGYTTEEREAKLKKMEGIATAYNIWGGAVPIIVIFFHNNSLIFYMGFLYPLLGLIILKLSRGLVKFITNPQRSIYSNISIGFLTPIIILLVVAIKAYQILSFAAALKAGLIVGLTLFVLLYLVGKNKDRESVKGQIFLMVLLSVLYGMSVTIVANCLFDTSVSAKYQTQVVDEYISSGKGAHYHLKLKPWLPGQDIKEVDVSEESYYKTPVGSAVIIYEKKGLLNIPWFDFELDPTPPAPAG